MLSLSYDYDLYCSPKKIKNMQEQSTKQITEAVLDKIQKLPLEKQQQILDFVDFVTQQHYEQFTETDEKNFPQERIAGLHRGQIWISDDFNDPLSDKFWGFES